MNHKDIIHELLEKISTEVLAFIKEQEIDDNDRWVPQTHINNSLDLKFLSVPRANRQYGEKGWLFAIIARTLEDEGLVEYKKENNSAYYRSTQKE